MKGISSPDFASSPRLASLGHVSLLRDADGVLFTADAFGCLPRKIRVGVRKYLCADPPLADALRGRLLGEGLFDRDLRPRKDPAKGGEGAATRGRRQVQVLGTLEV